MRKLRLAWFTEFNPRRWEEGAEAWGFGHDWRDASFYSDMGRTLERGLFDMLISADASVLPRFDGSGAAYLRNGESVGFLTPSLVMSLIAGSTQHLGLVPTLSTMVYPPYLLAREMATLDSLSGGRAGWNIVTSTDDGTAQNLGLDRIPPRDERYERADEYLEVCEKLWASWDPGSIRMDTTEMLFVRPEHVREIDHQGKWFRVRGPLNTVPGPQGRPLFLQAGGSPRGMDFAAEHADAVISHSNSLDTMRQYSREIRERAASFGRDPRSIKIFFTFKPFIGDTTAEAHAKRERLIEFVMQKRVELGLISLSGKAGFDVSNMPLDEPLTLADFENAGGGGILGFYYQHYAEGADAPTIREIAGFEAIKESLPLVGTPAEICETLAEISEDADFDGIAIREVMSPLRTGQIVDRLVPELRRRKMIRSSFRHRTLRENLFDDEA